jgi:uncharacterized iron-regulated membrane protein
MGLLDVLHRWAGGLIGLLLALQGLSGAILVHKDAWIDLPHAADPQVTETAAVAATVQRIMSGPDHPQSILFASESLGLHKLTFGDGGGAYASQSGDVVTRWQGVWERPELWLFDFHHYLFAGETGETIIGLLGLCALFFVISGSVLWWRARKTFAFRLWPKRLTRSAIVRQHRDLGIVVAPLLLLTIYTGLTMVFRPTTVAVLGPSAPATIDTALKPPPAGDAPYSGNMDWAALIGTARARFPNAEFRVLSLPKGGVGLISLRMKQPAEWLPNGRTTLYFDAATGELREARDALALPRQARGFNMLYPLHAGKVGGLPYRLLVTLSGMALTLLGTLAVWSFWFRRPRRKMAPDVREASLAPS